jgi:nanoRNase/pAp phosphatase (c-di-AMP/oligoRNAs hydrolase)
VLNRAFKKARIYGDALTTSIGRIKNPDMVAEVADMLLRHEGVEWVLAMGTFQKSIIVSLRTSDLKGGAGEIVQSIVRGFGKAGGHGMMAGGKVDMNGHTIKELEENMVERFLKKIGTIDHPAEALV